jgi:hypothetical protein
LWGGGYNELVYYFLLRQITFISRVNNLSKHCRAVIGLRDRDHMIIEYTATYAITHPKWLSRRKASIINVCYLISGNYILLRHTFCIYLLFLTFSIFYNKMKKQQKTHPKKQTKTKNKQKKHLITWVAFVKPIYLSFDGVFGFLCYKYIDINFQFNLSFNKSFWPCIADNT